MSLYSIYVPTYDRAESIITPNWLEDVIVVCPESQIDEYREENPEFNYKACPDSVEGNMAKKRNWIRENRDNDYFIMIDDDIKNLKVVEGGEQWNLREKEAYELFYQGFQLMEDIGTVLWGINLNTDPLCYREYSPFSMISVILAPFHGQKYDKTLHYDERLPTKEDYDFALQVLHKYHKVIRLNKYSYQASHLDNSDGGGSVGLRTKKLEERQAQLMQDKWGKDVVQIRDDSIDPVVKCPLSGI